MVVTNENYILKEVKNGLDVQNIHNYSVQNLSSACLRSKHLQTTIAQLQFYLFLHASKTCLLPQGIRSLKMEAADPSLILVTTYRTT